MTIKNCGTDLCLCGVKVHNNFDNPEIALIDFCTTPIISNFQIGSIDNIFPNKFRSIQSGTYLVN